MRIELNNLCNLSFGPYLPPSSVGKIPYLQIRQFDENGILNNVTSEFVELNEKTKGYLLKDGDVLFVGKGSRLFAWCYTSDFGPAIASSIFYVLRIRSQKLNPQYLATILNLQKSKNTFHQMGAGTNIFSIRKSELGAFNIPLLSIEKQTQIASLAQLHQREIQLAQQIISQKQNLYSEIISKLVN